MSTDFFDRHRETLERAVRALGERDHYSAYPEVPSGKIYGETAKADGQAAFEARLGQPFEIDQPTTGGHVTGETSPYGLELGVQYPASDVSALVEAGKTAMRDWAAATSEERVGTCLEIIHRLNQRSFEMACAVMHTTGQGFMMAFQAGGPHAQDRALEAVASAWIELTRTPAAATWRKQVGRDEVVTLEKSWRVVPRGVAAVVACSTFPTWNGYPGIFASLATGNAVIVKPHPGAVLPLAISVDIAREVLREAGFDPNLLMLAVDTPDAPVTGELVTHPDVRIVDYTGGSSFGSWIEENARQAVVFTEKAGINSVILDSIDDLRAVTGNLAFSLSLYSGQMCTTSQNIFIPRDGITVGGEQMSFDDVAAAIVKAVDWLLGDPRRATEILGAIQNPQTAARIDEAAASGTVVRESPAITNDAFPDATVRGPLILRVNAADETAYGEERFGPIVYLVATEDTAQSIEIAARLARERGAITGSVYSTDDDVLDSAVDALTAAGVAVSCNLTGSIWVNQSAAFSDFHVSGANPAGNACLCDSAFIAGRFRLAQSRRPAPVAAAVEEATVG